MSQDKALLVVIKHDAIARGYVGKIIAALEEAGGQITHMRMQYLTLIQAQELYLEHAGKPFYNDLCTWMCLAPCILMRVVETNQSLNDLKPTIRFLYGFSTRANAIHISDSLNAGKRELKIFSFPL